MNELTGSPRQIAWATDIRNRREQELNAWLDRNVATLRSVAVEKPHLTANMEETAAKITAEVAQLLNDNTDSRYWINTRNLEHYVLLNEFFAPSR